MISQSINHAPQNALKNIHRVHYNFSSFKIFVCNMQKSATHTVRERKVKPVTDAHTKSSHFTEIRNMEDSFE